MSANAIGAENPGKRLIKWTNPLRHGKLMTNAPPKATNRISIWVFVDISELNPIHRVVGTSALFGVEGYVNKERLGDLPARFALRGHRISIVKRATRRVMTERHP